MDVCKRLCYNQPVLYNNTKVKGDAAELEVFIYLKRHGYVVSLPFGENQPYDMVAESPTGRLYRIQVRYVSESSGSISISLRRSSQGSSKTLDLSRIDVFAGWDGKHVYFVLTKNLGNVRAAVSLRTLPALNNQSRGIRRADQHRNALYLIP